MSIYQKFCKEHFDDAGRLIRIQLEYPDDFNFGYDVVDAIAAESPQKRALVWCNAAGDENVFSFADIAQLSNRAANVLHNAGLRKGDRVMVILKRHYEYWICAVAMHKLGLVMIPATHMLTVDDMRYRMDCADVQAVVCTYQNSVPDKIAVAMKQSNRNCRLWTVGKDVDGFGNLNKEMERASDHLERRATKVSDPMVVYFTSGTTGYPKGVIHDFSYPLAHIVTAKYWQQTQEDGLHFTVAETGWAKASWGKIYGQWLTGCAVMVYDFDNFDPRQLVGVINRYGVTSFCAPPTVYRYLVRKGIEPMPTLRHAVTAGEMLSTDVFEKFESITGICLSEGYGQTETALLTANFMGHDKTAGTVGISSPMYDVRIIRPDGTQTECGEIGEIVIVPRGSRRQPGIFTGYLGNEEQYEHVWRGGVYHTGDAAWIDEAGLFRFHGRFDDIIKTGGFRVGPYEIENILNKHPAVLECCVVGAPDPVRGQSIKAIVHPADGFLPGRELEKELRDFCNGQLAEYKWIRSVEFVKEMPKTISGKIRKGELCKGS